MSFTAHDLTETSRELRSEIGRLLSKPTEPDVLLGNHPLSVFASQKQSIAIWHGTRIENHLADWIGKFSAWSAKPRERISIQSAICEIDNLAWSSSLGLVVAVEAKRVWSNQDKSSKGEVKQKKDLYTKAASSQLIATHVGQPGAAFRHFVFDAYGNTKKGRNGLSVIAGDKIEGVFGCTFAKYVRWEQKVLANALFVQLEQQQSVDLAGEERLTQDLLADRPMGSVTRSLREVLKFIDEHASP